MAKLHPAGMKTRDLNLDLYRFFCMFIITISFHFIGYTGITENITAKFGFNHILVSILNALKPCGINGFIILSAYFLINERNTLKKIIRFESLLLFFSIIISIAAMVLKPALSPALLLKSVFPFLTGHYWYPVNYMILLVFVPFLNRLIYSLTKKQFQIFSVSIVFISTIFFGINIFYDSAIYLGHESHSILWFIILYICTAYYKLYGIPRELPFAIISFCVCFLLQLAYFLVENGGSSRAASLMEYTEIMKNNSLLSLVMAFSSFIIFKHIKVPATPILKKVFGFLTPTAFVIYLIQENNFVRPFLWESLQLSQFANSWCLIFVMFAVFIGLLLLAMLFHGLYLLCKKLFLTRLEDKLIEKALYIYIYIYISYHELKKHTYMNPLTVQRVSLCSFVNDVRLGKSE